eukprot:gene12145-13398_t
MGNFSSRNRSRAEKEQMKEEIKHLSMILQSLQRELSHFKGRSADVERQMTNTEKDLIRETSGCSKQIYEMQNMFNKALERLEDDFEAFRRRSDEANHSYCLDKRNIFKKIEAQERQGEELGKCLEEWRSMYASLNDLNEMKTAMDAMKASMRESKKALKPTILKLLGQKSPEWDNEYLNLMAKLQMIEKHMGQLFTHNCLREREVRGLNARLDKLDGANSSSLFEEVLAEPTLPGIDKVTPMKSEAYNITAVAPVPYSLGENDYQFKFSKISSMMKIMNSEMKASDNAE